MGELIGIIAVITICYILIGLTFAFFLDAPDSDKILAHVIFWPLIIILKAISGAIKIIVDLIYD